MGNRAVIAYESQPTIGIYLHWNGGPESVLAFLEAAKQRGARSPGGDSTYSFAYLTHTIGDFMSSGSGYGLSLGVGPLSTLDTNNGDNGLYWIGSDWQIIRREHRSGAMSVDGLSPTDRETYDAILAQLTS